MLQNLGYLQQYSLRPHRLCLDSWSQRKLWCLPISRPKFGGCIPTEIWPRCDAAFECGIGKYEFNLQGAAYELFEHSVFIGSGGFQEDGEMSSAELAVDLFFGVAHGFYRTEMFVVPFLIEWGC